MYHTVRVNRDDSGYGEVSATESELRAILQDTPSLNKGRKVLQHDDKDPDDSNELDMQHWRERTETDAKVGATRHPSRQLNGTAKRAGNPADAKVGSTQHPSLKSSASCRSDLDQLSTCRRILCPSSGQGSEKSRMTKRQVQQKCRQDKAECRQRKKQNRRPSGKPISKVFSDDTATTTAETTDTTEEVPQKITNREVLDRTNSIRKDYAELKRQRGTSNPAMRRLFEEFDEVNEGFIEWEHRFIHHISASVCTSAEASYVGEAKDRPTMQLASK